ncbi:hypothetical protein BC939DRAFT_437211, partial [Gamsiella multidivaricata]|uniref:uncharacterized protein n=1 Tax=Gamsiella multidivaricata TaxID=101098 RepID=UPI00221F04BF
MSSTTEKHVCCLFSFITVGHAVLFFFFFCRYPHIHVDSFLFLLHFDPRFMKSNRLYVLSTLFSCALALLSGRCIVKVAKIEKKKRERRN